LAKALSPLTLDREHDDLMPSQCNMASTVMAFRVAPTIETERGRAESVKLEAKAGAHTTLIRGQAGAAAQKLLADAQPRTR
jgi:hypothetical protein